MNNCCNCLRLVGARRLAKWEFLTNTLNYRSLISCSRLSSTGSWSQLREESRNRQSCFKRHTGFKSFTTSSQIYAAHGKDISIAASFLDESVRVSEKSTNDNDQLLGDLEKGLLELEDLVNTDIKIVPTVVTAYSDGIEKMDNVELDGKTTTFTLPRSGNKVFELFGTPDPKQPPSNVNCPGCGAFLHCKDPGIPGYLPSQAYLSVPKSHLKDCRCQRCQLLADHEIALDVTVPLDKFNPIIREVKKHTALVILLVDMTDIANSFHRTFKYVQSVGRPVFVIGNKVDLIPKDDEGYLDRLMKTLVETAKENGFSEETNVRHFSLISAKTGYGVENLITKMLDEWRLRGHVFIMGCANCGKSTLFNTLLASDYCRNTAREIIHRATTSIWPGTTLNLLKFPIINPKPDVLHLRKERLKRLARQSENKLNESRKRNLPNLNSRIGSTLLTLTENAIVQRNQTKEGFVVPSYSYEENHEGGEMVESVGHEGAVEYLDLKVNPYNDETFRYWCYDTPGLINPDQIINLLNQSELLRCVPKKGITSRTYIMKPGQTMFVSGLSRIDFCEGDDNMFFTVFASMDVPVNVVNLEEADQYYKEHLGTETFGIPIGDEERLRSLPPLVGTEFKVEGEGTQHSTADVVLSSLGWVALTFKHKGKGVIKAYTPGAAGCKLRAPLLRYAPNFRGSRIGGTNRYRTPEEETMHQNILKKSKNAPRHVRKNWNARV